MRIGIVMGFFLPVPAAAGGATEKMMAALAERFARAGHQTTIYSRTWPGFPETEEQGGVTHRRLRGIEHSRHLPINLLFDLWWSSRLLRCVGSHDVLITHSVLFPILYKWFGDRKAKVVPWTGRMPKGQARLYGGVDGIVVPSKAVELEVLRENPSLESKLIRVPNPIDWERLSGGSGIRDDATVKIGYVGRIHPEKNIEALIDGAARLSDMDLPAWELWIVGPTAIDQGGGGEGYTDGLRSRMTEKIPGRGKMLPPVFEAERLAEVYGSLDIFCYPSLAARGEGLSVAPLEAMAAGAVPVVSDLDCFKDYISEGENGYVIPCTMPSMVSKLTSILARLVRDPEERSRLGRAARKTARSFDYGRVSEMLLEHFSAIVR